MRSLYRLSSLSLSHGQPSTSVALLLQLQFCITLSHTVLVYFLNCGFPLWGIYLLGGYMVIMLILFSNFYIQTYLKAAKARKQQAASSNGTITNGSMNGATANGVNGHANKKHE
jgi:hypothetical protein